MEITKSEAYKILREHRFICQRQGLDVTKINNTIKLVEQMNEGKKIGKSTMLRIIADCIDLNKHCASIYMTLGELNAISQTLFKELLNDNQI